MKENIMKDYIFENNFGKFIVTAFPDGTFSVHGNMKAAQHEFKKIGRMPPNKYGNFYGRENAGFAACRELIDGKKG